jgi:hypothetical protein
LAAILNAAVSSNIPVRQPQLAADLILKSELLIILYIKLPKQLATILIYDTKNCWYQNSSVPARKAPALEIEEGATGRNRPFAMAFTPLSAQSNGNAILGRKVLS